ncbi:DUF2846 domain-containing protein [Halomonas sp. E19]|uniref:DUF2846 domain-containing protein n=1 Tax=Halomonas sp. E19 TaxID=3397247 RepID=UPI0040342F69
MKGKMMHLSRQGKIFAALVLLLLITGCAAKAPSSATMQAELAGFVLPQEPQENEGMVYVVRPELKGTLVRFNVFLNDQQPSSEVGHTRGKQHIYFPVSPGRHTVYSKAENWASVDIDVAPGEVVFLRQEARMGVVMARNALTQIDDQEGRYFVKQTRLGTLGQSAEE